MPHLVGTLDIALLDAHDDVAVEQWVDLNERSRRAELPHDAVSRRMFRAALTHPEPGYRQEIYVARHDTQLVGAIKMDFPHLDNVENAMLEIVVEVARRREGIGRALYDFARERAGAMSRVRVIGFVPEPLPGDPDLGWPGVGFGRAMGGAPALTDIRQRLDIQSVDDGSLETMEADAIAHADGYTFVEWRGRAPDHLVDGLVELESRFSTDAPMGDLVWEQEAVDPDRLRGVEALLEARDSRWYDVAVVHNGTGDVAGTTRIVVNEDVAEQAWQWGTIVLPAHRGHRLGLLLKLRNLRALRRHEPAVRWIDTRNADSNVFMIKVNAAVGFVPRHLEHEWQIEL